MVEEYKIDGLRWDLTKVLLKIVRTQIKRTNNYQQDRVDVLKYTDYSWDLDPTHYVILNI
jgi:pullulanase/glycogen debranching enzyme